jgi:hypothetical protein
MNSYLLHAQILGDRKKHTMQCNSPIHQIAKP